MALFSNLRYRRGGNSLAVRSVPSTGAELASDFSNVPRGNENSTNRERIRARDCATSLFDGRGGKRLSQLLALFVAIAVIPSMVFAGDEDHINGPDKVHDPTGAWLLNTPSGFVLTVFHKGGTLTGDFQGENSFEPTATNPPRPPLNVQETPESGVWQKTGWNTFAVTFLTIESQVDTSNNTLSTPLYEFDKVQFTAILTDSGNKMESTAAVITTFNSDGSLKQSITVPVKVYGVRIPLEVLPNTSHTLPIPPEPVPFGR
jgi:hypothetical protein